MKKFVALFLSLMFVLSNMAFPCFAIDTQASSDVTETTSCNHDGSHYFCGTEFLYGTDGKINGKVSYEKQLVPIDIYYCSDCNEKYALKYSDAQSSSDDSSGGSYYNSGKSGASLTNDCDVTYGVSANKAAIYDTDGVLKDHAWINYTFSISGEQSGEEGKSRNALILMNGTTGTPILSYKNDGSLIDGEGTTVLEKIKTDEVYRFLIRYSHNTDHGYTTFDVFYNGKLVASRSCSLSLGDDVRLEVQGTQADTFYPVNAALWVHERRTTDTTGVECVSYLENMVISDYVNGKIHTASYSNGSYSLDGKIGTDKYVIDLDIDADKCNVSDKILEISSYGAILALDTNGQITSMGKALFDSKEESLVINDVSKISIVVDTEYNNYSIYVDNKIASFEENGKYFTKFDLVNADANSLYVTTGDGVAKIKISEIPEGAPQFIGSQIQENAQDLTFNTRFVIGVNDIFVQNVEIEIKGYYTADQNNLSEIITQRSKLLTTTNVYSSFLSDGEYVNTYSTEKGDYFALLTVNDIEKNEGFYVFELRTGNTKDDVVVKSDSVIRVVYQVDAKGYIKFIEASETKQNTSPNAPTSLKVNKLSLPYGIEGTPMMSWVVNDADNNEIQTAYQIKVSNKADMSEIIWDSGKVTSNRNTDVECEGINLNANSLYYWTVCTWDNGDVQSEWSVPQSFSTAVGSDWNSSSIWGASAEGEEVISSVTYDVDFDFDPFGTNTDTQALAFVFAAQNGDLGVAGHYYYVVDISRDTSDSTKLKVSLAQYVEWGLNKYYVQNTQVLAADDGAENLKLTVSKNGAKLIVDLTVNGMLVGNYLLSDSEGTNALPINYGARQGANCTCYIDSISVTRQDGMTLYENDFSGGTMLPFDGVTVKDGYWEISKAFRKCYTVGDSSLLNVPYISYDVDFKFNEGNSSFTFTFNQQTENGDTLLDYFVADISPTSTNKGIKVQPSFRGDVNNNNSSYAPAKEITLSSEASYSVRDSIHNLQIICYKTDANAYADIYIDGNYMMVYDLTAGAQAKVTNVELYPNFGVRQGGTYSCLIDGINVMGTGGLVLYESGFDFGTSPFNGVSIDGGALNIAAATRKAYHIDADRFVNKIYVHKTTAKIENGGAQYAFNRQENGQYYSLQFNVTPDSGNNVRVIRWTDNANGDFSYGGARIAGIQVDTDYCLKLVTYGNKAEIYWKKPADRYYNLILTTTLASDDTQNSVFGVRQGGSDIAYLDDLSVFSIAVDEDEAVVHRVYESDFSDGNSPIANNKVTVSDGYLKLDKGAVGFRESDVNIAFLRKEIQLDTTKTVEKAVVSAIALSRQQTKQYTFKLYVNGKCVGLGSPENTSNSINELYSTFDVTEYLNCGENLGTDVIGAICYALDDRRFALQMTVYYTDGTTDIIVSDDTWSTLDGSKAYGEDGTYIQTNPYIAMTENIDMRYFPQGWSEVGFDDSGWTKPIVKDDIENLSASPISALYQYEMPVSGVGNSRNTENNTYTSLVTLEKEVIGGIRLMLPENTKASGTIITLKFGEELEGGHVKDMNTGNNYTEYWTLTDGVQVIESFGMKCFRYVEISNLPISLTNDRVVGLAYRQEFDETESSFVSSDELLNAIYDTTKYSMQATNQDLYVDAQSRERAASNSGDVYINLKTSHSVSNDYTLAIHSTDWISDTDTSIMEYNVLAIMSAWELYMYTGDTALIEKNYDDYVRKMGGYQQGLALKNGLYYVDYGDWATNDYSPTVLIDWFPMERDGYNIKESYYNTVVNAYQYKALTILSDMAKLLGKTEDSESYRAQAETLKANIKEKLYDKDTGLFFDGLTSEEVGVKSNSGSLDNGNKSVPATLYPLLFGIIDKGTNEYTKAVNAVAAQGMTGSVYGAQFLWELLYKAELGEDAYNILTKECDHTTDGDKRSYDHMINCLGATITTEAWDVTHKANMTFSHPWGAAGGNAIVEGLCGVTPLTAGFEQINIKPQMGTLEWFSVVVPTVKGAVKIVADNSDSRFEMTAEIPVNSTADVYLPINGSNSYIAVMDGGKLLEGEYEICGDYILIKKVGSGEHSFSIQYETSAQTELAIDTLTLNDASLRITASVPSSSEKQNVYFKVADEKERVVEKTIVVPAGITGTTVRFDITGFYAGKIVVTASLNEDYSDGISKSTQRELDSTVMRELYEEIATPYEYDLVLKFNPSNIWESTLVDNPTVFRIDGDDEYVYMTYVGHSGSANSNTYSTGLARSKDMVTWESLGLILKDEASNEDVTAGAWNKYNAAGYIVRDHIWGEIPTPHKTDDGYYVMSYLASTAPGYEKGQVQGGIAFSESLFDSDGNPIIWERGDTPILKLEGDQYTGPYAHEFANSGLGGTRTEKHTVWKPTIVKNDENGKYYVFYNAGHYPEIMCGAIADVLTKDDYTNWERMNNDDDTNLLIDAGTISPAGGAWGTMQNGDADVVKIGDYWVMFYFTNHGGIIDSFAVSKDLENWELSYMDLIRPNNTWSYEYAHKPCVIKKNGVVYHYFNAVGDQGRNIGLSTSIDLSVLREAKAITSPSANLIAAIDALSIALTEDNGSIEKIQKAIEELKLVMKTDPKNLAVSFDSLTAEEQKNVQISVTTNKNPLTYEEGEEITFYVELKNGAQLVSCPEFKYTVKSDYNISGNTGYVDGSDGKFAVTTTFDSPGFVLLDVKACDDNRSTLTYAANSVSYVGGAGVEVDNIQISSAIPDDMESHWSEIVTNANSGNIILQRFEKLDTYSSWYNVNNATHYLYLVELTLDGWAGEYATGYLTVPKNLGTVTDIKLTCDYFGIHTSTPDFTANTVSFAVCAHSIDMSADTISPETTGIKQRYEKDDNGYWNVEYFENMIKRDLLAARFLKEYAGGESFTLNSGIIKLDNVVWNDGDFTVSGTSQGGFQAIAVAAFDSAVTNVDIAYPWLCDTNSNEIGRLTSSLRATNHSDHLELYIDTVSLASLIPSDVDVKIMAGMADDTSLPTGVLALYNVLSCNKEIIMKQGRTHTYEPNNAETYVKTNK